MRSGQYAPVFPVEVRDVDGGRGGSCSGAAPESEAHTRQAGEIGRKPANLHLHIQRISLWHGLGDEAATAAAVIDLWIVLGALGQDLRTRMLRQHYTALDKFELGLYLSEHLQGGLDRHDPLIALPGSVLSRPVAGARAFLRKVSMPSATAP